MIHACKKWRRYLRYPLTTLWEMFEHEYVFIVCHPSSLDQSLSKEHKV